MTSVKAPERIYADKDYRDHGYDGAASVMLLGHKRAMNPRMNRELNRRPSIEASIGRMKTDVRLDHNFLTRHVGDAINALLSGVGHNLHLILTALAVLLACTLQAARQPGEMAKPDTSPGSNRYQISIA